MTLFLQQSEPEGRHITSQQSREERSGGEWAERLWMLSSCTSPLQGTQKGFIVESQLFMLLSCITLCFTGSNCMTNACLSFGALLCRISLVIKPKLLVNVRVTLLYIMSQEHLVCLQYLVYIKNIKSF